MVLSCPASLLPHLLASLLYVHNVVYDRFSAISAVAWSLEVEIQFYLLAPLFGLIFSLRRPLLRRLLFAGIGAIAVVAQHLVASRWGFHFRWSGTLPGQLQYFMVGMLVADVHLTGGPPETSPSLGWDVAAVIAVYSLGVALHDGQIVFRFVELPAIFLLYMAAFRSRLLRGFLRAPLVSTLGGMCYSIYLLHTWVIFFWHPVIARWAGAPSYPVRFAIFVGPVALSVVLVAAVYFVLVERPCMDRAWPSRLMGAIRRGAGRRA